MINFSDLLSKASSVLPLILMFGALWLLVIRPQQKKAKEHQALIAQLKKGDRVILTGGISAVVDELLSDTLYVQVQIADGVSIKVLRSGIVEAQKEQGQEEKNSPVLKSQ
jgi:preprotein translocase subunit YajC